jgi:predicted Zn-dependent protease
MIIDIGCTKTVKGGSSAKETTKTSYDVVLDPGQIGVLLKKQIQKAFIGARNADGMWAN